MLGGGPPPLANYGWRVTAPIKVLIADDHAVVRNGLKMLLELEDDIVVAGEAADGREAVDEAQRLCPDVVLMDLTMPEVGGIEATKLLQEACPAAKVLVLTSIVEDSQILAAVRAGAAGYLLKEASPEEVSESVRAVHRGEPLLHPDAARSLMRELSQPSRVPEGTVTILFTDIEGSAQVFDRLGDDAARTILREHDVLLREVVETHGGVEVKHQGDGLMLAFSSARRACSAPSTSRPPRSSATRRGPTIRCTSASASTRATSSPRTTTTSDRA